MCDKEFKELVKIAVEKLKDESVLKLLQADASYQKDSKDEGYAEDALHSRAKKSCSLMPMHRQT